VRKVSIIGIGAGDPEHVTVQAVRALNAVDVFFVVTKGTEQQELVDLRTAVLERYVEQPTYRVVEVRDPERERGATSSTPR
jgi:precorrin-6A synthase